MTKLIARLDGQIIGTRTGKADFKFAIVAVPNIEYRRQSAYGDYPHRHIFIEGFERDLASGKLHQPQVLCWSKTAAAAQKAAETHIREQYWTGVVIVPAEEA
jgi:hypothetical protein